VTPSSKSAASSAMTAQADRRANGGSSSTGCRER
jgi:hypothetical protein